MCDKLQNKLVQFIDANLYCKKEITRLRQALELVENCPHCSLVAKEALTLPTINNSTSVH